MELTTNKSGEAYPFKEQFERLFIKTTTLASNLEVRQLTVIFGAWRGQLAPSPLMSSHSQRDRLQGLFWWRGSQKVMHQSKALIYNLNFVPPQN